MSATSSSPSTSTDRGVHDATTSASSSNNAAADQVAGIQRVSLDEHESALELLKAKFPDFDTYTSFVTWVPGDVRNSQGPLLDFIERVTFDKAELVLGAIESVTALVVGHKKTPSKTTLLTMHKERQRKEKEAKEVKKTKKTPVPSKRKQQNKRRKTKSKNKKKEDGSWSDSDKSAEESEPEEEEDVDDEGDESLEGEEDAADEDEESILARFNGLVYELPEEYCAELKDKTDPVRPIINCDMLAWLVGIVAASHRADHVKRAFLQLIYIGQFRCFDVHEAFVTGHLLDVVIDIVSTSCAHHVRPAHALALRGVLSLLYGMQDFEAEAAKDAALRAKKAKKLLAPLTSAEVRAIGVQASKHVVKHLVRFRPQQLQVLNALLSSAKTARTDKNYKKLLDQPVRLRQYYSAEPAYSVADADFQFSARLQQFADLLRPVTHADVLATEAERQMRMEQPHIVGIELGLHMLGAGLVGITQFEDWQSSPIRSHVHEEIKHLYEQMTSGQLGALEGEEAPQAEEQGNNS